MSSPTPSATSTVEAGNAAGKIAPAIDGAKTNTPSTTPVTATSPTPPSPLLIGTSFIKQYYQVLSKSPQLIHRFYKPNTSVLSHSFLSSVPAESKTLNQSDIFDWAVSSKESNSGDAGEAGGTLCFDFGRGAIDAQETIQGGILLVVTGHMKLPNAKKTKAFVHTFLLNNGAPAGKKRQFYVHNDILRVIGESDAEPALEPESSPTPPTPQQLQDSTAPTAENSATLTTTVTEETAVAIVDAKNHKSEKPLKPAAQAQDIIEPTPDSPTISFEKPPTSKGGHSKSNVHSNAIATDHPSVKSSTKTESKRKNSNSSIAKTDPTPNVNKTPVDGGGSGRKKNQERSNSSNDVSPTPKEERKSKKNKGKGGRSRKDRGRSPSSDQTDSNGAKTPTTTGTSTKQKDSKDSKNQNASSNNKPKVPGSWAGIVAGAGGPGTTAPSVSNTSTYPTPSSPSRPSAAAATAAATAAAHLASSNSAAVEESKEGMDMDGIDKPIAASKPDNGQETTHSNNSVNSRGGQPPRSNSSNHQSLGNTITQRTAEATLFVKNIPDKTKEADVRSIFEPYATTANKKILGITLHASRGFCFVDFDAKIVVDTILKDVEASKEANKASGSNGEGSKFFIYGKFLDVGRKVQVDKGRGGGSSSQHRYRNRSASPGNGAYHKPRGGGHHHRRNSPRGGNRGTGGPTQQQQQQQSQRNPTK